VLLVGDIDRGGVFASLYGTAALLEDWERRHLAGLIINKFRGDVALLRPGLTQIETLTGLPVVGVVPWLRLDIDDEDSLSSRLEGRPGAFGAPEIAILRFPRISNFTDFAPLETLPGVSVRYVTCLGELGEPDFIILPGTKSTIGDLLWLRQNGLEAAIKKLAARGTPVLGVCGGYQMLGRTLTDPEGVEAAPGTTVAGLGLLPADTVFGGEKVRTRMAGQVLTGPAGLAGLEKAPVEGYEIHMGRTVVEEGLPPFCRIAPVEGGREREAVAGNVWGTYLHGLFDSGELLSRLWRLLAERKGLDLAAAPAFDPAAHREEQYSLLAAALRQSLDMAKIYRILEEGI
jgi:adenosylcobyric acid synthase